jgi:dihydrodipicolinate synthase/N-acetylneuraminate lyase
VTSGMDLGRSEAGRVSGDIASARADSSRHSHPAPRRRQAILASCQLPLDSRERLLVDVFEAEVDFLTACGFTSLYIFGTAGEGYAVDNPTFREVTQLFHDLVARRSIDGMVSVIQLSTSCVIERLAVAYDIGFRKFQVALPAWSALADGEVMRFFEAICGTFPDCQFLHYNVAHAKRVLSGKEYRRLADANPNLVATKNVSGGAGRAADLMRHAPDLQHFFGEDNYLHGAMFGECSLLTTLGALAPQLTHEYFEAGVARDAARLLELHHRFEQIRDQGIGQVVGRHMVDGAYDKLILRLGGFDAMPLTMMSPYQGFSSDEYAAIAQNWNGAGSTRRVR